MIDILARRNEHGGMRDDHQPPSFDASDWLHFAATPTFVLMALIMAVSRDGPADMLCPATHGMSPLGGMAVMYLLMAAFHAGPWLKLIAGRRRKVALDAAPDETRTRLPCLHPEAGAGPVSVRPLQ